MDSQPHPGYAAFPYQFSEGTVHMRRMKALVAVVGLSLLMTACSSGSSHSTTGNSGAAGDINGPHKKGGTVTIANEQGQTWPCQFNPFNPAVNTESDGFVYEPLVFVNLLSNQAETPMLASSYSGRADKKSIVFTIRDGVKWSDGQPFSAADVAFTFNLMKTLPGDRPLRAVDRCRAAERGRRRQQGHDDVQGVAQPYFFNFANQVGIVPQHIFSTGAAAAHPDTWADPNPVGTGPFMVDPCTPNNIQFTANPHVLAGRQAVHPEGGVSGVPGQRPGEPGPGQRKGPVGEPVHPEHQEVYLSKSSNNNTWSPPVTNVDAVPEPGPVSRGHQQARGTPGDRRGHRPQSGRRDR